MRISILQTDVAWADIDENCNRAEQLLASVPMSDMYVLPEMWSTGFATSPIGVADAMGKSLRWMQTAAKKLDAVIAGSVAVEEDGFSNRHYFVYPDGTYRHYDKRHLFSYGGEDAHYRAGNERVIAEWQGIRFLLLTCYDLRFPVWSRNRGDYDAILIVANWPESRISVWNTLLAARALENQCYVVAANRVGKDQQCEYIGGSMVIDAKGKTIAHNNSANQEIITADINLEELKLFRSKFQVLNDADTFLIAE